jgi:alpha-L-fucosidase
MYCLIHFGVNTYLDHEWGYGDEDPNLIDPVDFDPRQIVGAAKAGGFKGIIVVAKHHDGLCLWPTKTTTHNISQSHWKNGKGDIVKGYEEACRALGMSLGIYCSPWDRNNPAYGTPAYLAIYRAQLRELYSHYGPLFMSWHDGANGGDGYYGGARERRNIDRTTYYDWDSTWRITRQMQPGAVIFGDIGPDVRWVGNEQGHAGETCWATFTPQAPDPGHKPANGYSKYELAPEGTRNGDYWMPAECDVPLRPGWFYHASQDEQVRTPAQLLDLYYASVGRGADLDLGLAPNKRGLLDAHDVRSLKAFGDLLRQTFAVNLAAGARLTPSNVRGNDRAHYGPAFLLDNDRYSYWATDDGITNPSVEFDLGSLKTFNVIRLRENIRLGQRIDSIAVDVWVGAGAPGDVSAGAPRGVSKVVPGDMSAAGQWRRIAVATSIGPNRLIRLGHNITTDKVRLRITGSPVCIALSDFGLYKEKLQAPAPVIRRESSGMVSMVPGSASGASGAGGAASGRSVTASENVDARLPIHYTLDGSTPGLASPLYTVPFLLAQGGTVKARSIDKEVAGDIRTQVFGISHSGWSIVSAPEGSHGERAIDEDESTDWSTLGEVGGTQAPAGGTVGNTGGTPQNAPFPQDITVDMGKEQLVKAFTYLPRQDRKTAGIVDRYAFYTSEDGKDWEKVKQGEFSNIAANPLQQLVLLKSPVKARYFRFSALHTIGERGVSVAELGVVTRITGNAQTGYNTQTAYNAQTGHNAATVGARPEEARYDLIPYPSSLEPREGSFVITEKTGLIVQGRNGLFKNEADFLRQMIRGYLGAGALKGAGVLKGSGALKGAGVLKGSGTLKQDNRVIPGAIILAYDKDISSPEGYTLVVDSKRIVLKAATPAGMFYAVETLRQLMPASVETGVGGKTATKMQPVSGMKTGRGMQPVPGMKTGPARTISVPAVEIADQPAFAWRGMMLDVSRHFFSVAYVRKFIDRMALYKLNTLHLHLTDDQGWRIEIKKYPRLTEESGWRTLNSQDSACLSLAAETGNPDFDLDSTHLRYRDGRMEYGGFYTQEQMKEIIRYAASRHIEIIPEIDMPGHMMAATALYPWLTCDGDQGADGSRGFSNPICPCKDSAMQFARDVFSEIIDLFPSKYIHIGGDEVEKKAWENSPLVHAFMAQHRIGTPDQLQSYFNDRMEAFFRARGKTLVGWDEIVEGGMDSSAVVMFWRPWARQSPLKATRNGNKLVMTPDGPFYFDAWPDRNSLDAVYHYNPTDAKYGMDEAEQKKVFGVQANLWTERVPTENRADYLVMPRMTALAELGWTHKDLYDSYLRRLDGQYERLDLLGVHYRLPDLADLADNHVFIDTTSFRVEAPSPRFTVRYTTDGSNPVASSPALSRPIPIDHSLTLKMAVFSAVGGRGDVYTLSFERQAYAPALTRAQVVAVRAANGPVTAVHAASGPDSPLSAGLECRFYKGYFDRTTKIKGAPDSVLKVSRIGVPSGISAPEFGLKFTGYLDVPETGIYSFFLTSNDGSLLRIADRLVVDNDGLHGDKEKSGQVALEKGPHVFALDFMEAGGGYALKLKYSKDNGEPREVPEEWFLQ